MAMTHNIPDTAWVRFQDSTADIVQLGSFIAQTESVLRNIKVGFFKNNCSGQFRLRVHTSRDLNTNYAVSDWLDIDDIEHLLFLGELRFDFTKCVLSNGRRYYVTVEAASYVRNADVSYMCYTFDDPNTVNVSTGNHPVEFPIRMEIFNK